MDPTLHAAIAAAGTLLAARVASVWRLVQLRRRAYPLPRG